MQFYKWYKYVGYVFIVINIAIIYTLSNLVTDFGEYKNAGGNLNYSDALLVQGRVYFYYHWLSQTYLLMLPYHFYYLQNGNKKEGILAFICSLNFVLAGFTGFSRSNFVEFAFAYTFLYLYFRKSITIRFSKKAKYIIVSFFVILTLGFISITSNRFGGDNVAITNSFLHQDRIIENPVINSQLSYFSQWHMQTNKWMPKYDGSLLTNGSKGFPFIALVLSNMGITKQWPDYMEEIADKQIGSDTAAFLGVATDSVYDYGIIFSMVLLLLYNYLISVNVKSRSSSVAGFMLPTLLLLIPTFGIFNSILDNLAWHFAVVIYLFLMVLKKIKLS